MKLIYIVMLLLTVIALTAVIFAAAMIKGYNYEKCCIFSSAVSALKCTGFGARESVPDEKTVHQFLKK